MQDVNIVVQRLGVRDIIDLRSAEETDRDPADSGFESLVTRDIDYRRGPDGSMVATERPCKSPAGAAKGPGLTRHR